MIEYMLEYWRIGGPLMSILAMVSFVIWYFFLRLRSELLLAIKVPETFEIRTAQKSIFAFGPG